MPIKLVPNGIATSVPATKHPFVGKAAREFAQLDLEGQRRILASLSRLEEGVDMRIRAITSANGCVLRRMCVEALHDDGTIIMHDIETNNIRLKAGDNFDLVIRRAK